MGERPPVERARNVFEDVEVLFRSANWKRRVPGRVGTRLWQEEVQVTFSDAFFLYLLLAWNTVLTGLAVHHVLEIRILKKDLLKVMEVLAAASPALERRIMERGSQVVLGDRWVEEHLEEEELENS